MKGIIYKITDKETREVYIGSTTRPLKMRINQHRTQNSCMARRIVIKDNFKVEILEEIDFKDTIDKQLRECEQKHMDNSHNLINRQRAIGTIVNKEYFKNYYQNNKEKFAHNNEQRRKNYAFRKTWGENTNNLLDIKLDLFIF
jgi:hypothetical protein